MSEVAPHPCGSAFPGGPCVAVIADRDDEREIAGGAGDPLAMSAVAQGDDFSDALAERARSGRCKRSRRTRRTRRGRCRRLRSTFSLGLDRFAAGGIPVDENALKTRTIVRCRLRRDGRRGSANTQQNGGQDRFHASLIAEKCCFVSFLSAVK